MNKTIIIRNATVSDAEWIASVQIRSWKETYHAIIPQKYLNSLEINKKKKVWSELLSKPWTMTLIAEYWELVGFINYWVSREKTNYDWEVYSLYIREEYKWKWIWKELFLWARKDMVWRGFKSFYVWVLDKNPSKWFYEKMGGRVIGEKDVEIGDTRVKEIAYGWKSLDIK